uniref:Neurotransmitter-gated ion-channel ligand-binding domain-containing protein n=1 Tax=Romanomermis culicivorax TaxID=13658 RepID=A0A915JZP0_ROMCU
MVKEWGFLTISDHFLTKRFYIFWRKGFSTAGNPMDVITLHQKSAKTETNDIVLECTSSGSLIVLLMLIDISSSKMEEDNSNDEKFSHCSSSKQRLVNITEVIQALLVNYDRHQLPGPYGVNVSMEMHIQDISNINELSADFELDLMYSEIWLDPRLNFVNMSLCMKSITFRHPFRDLLWNPDTCIINSKNAEMHKSPSENKFVIVYEDGTVWINYRHFQLYNRSSYLMREENDFQQTFLQLCVIKDHWITQNPD